MTDYIEVDGLRVGPCMWRSKADEVEQLRARVAELTEMFAQGFDADGDLDEWRERAMKSIAGGLPSADAFSKRQQAIGIETWLFGGPELGNLDDFAQQLRDEADKAEQEQDHE